MTAKKNITAKVSPIAEPPVIPHVGRVEASSKLLVGKQRTLLPNQSSLTQIRALKKALEEQIYALVKGQLPDAARPPVYAARAAQLANEVGQLVSALNSIITQIQAEAAQARAAADAAKHDLQSALSELKTIPPMQRTAAQKLMIERKNEYLNELMAQIENAHSDGNLQNEYFPDIFAAVEELIRQRIFIDETGDLFVNGVRFETSDENGEINTEAIEELIRSLVYIDDGRLFVGGTLFEINAPTIEDVETRIQNHVRIADGDLYVDDVKFIVNSQPTTIEVGAAKVFANDFPGSELGEKIRNALTACPAGGTVFAAPYSGGWSKHVRVWREKNLHLLQGSYPLTTPYADADLITGQTVPCVAVIRESNGNFTGDGIGRTIIFESPHSDEHGHAFGIIATPNNNWQENNFNIEIRDFSLRGDSSRTGLSGRNSTVQINNVRNGLIERVHLKDTNALGVTVGGFRLNTSSDVFSDNFIVRRVRFSSVATQNLALTHGKNVTFDDCLFDDIGRSVGLTYAAIMDWETNSPECVLENAIIKNCRVIGLGAKSSFIALSITNDNQSSYNNLQVINNIFLGGAEYGDQGQFGNIGIYCALEPEYHPKAMRGVKISQNIFNRFTSQALCLKGFRCEFDANTVMNCGSQWYYEQGYGGAIHLVDASACSITNNKLYRYMPQPMSVPSLGISEKFRTDSAGNRVFTDLAPNYIANNPIFDLV